MAEQSYAPLNTQDQIQAVKTWRYLRVALVVLVAGLAVAVGYEVFHGSCKCFLTSISAYYYTPTQGYFVGALVAIGVCLFCLKGNTEGEDVLLNLAGVFAPVVAFVPTPDEDKSAVVRFTPEDIDANVTNNITALLVVGALGLILGAVLSKRNRPAQKALIGYGVAVAVYLAALLWFVIDLDSFVDHAHLTAAGLMFACIIAAVWLNAIGYKEKCGAESLRNRYLAIAIAMLSSVVVLFVAKLAGYDHWLLVLEALLIGLFAVFWFIQTVELWNEGLR
jgi:hypothetical protein